MKRRQMMRKVTDGDSAAMMDAQVFRTKKAAAPYLALGKKIAHEDATGTPGWHRRVLDLFIRRHRIWQSFSAGRTV